MKVEGESLKFQGVVGVDMCDTTRVFVWDDALRDMTYLYAWRDFLI